MDHKLNAHRQRDEWIKEQTNESKELMDKQTVRIKKNSEKVGLPLKKNESMDFVQTFCWPPPTPKVWIQK